MNDPQNVTMSYLGFLNPSSLDELEFEMIGLERLIKEAESRILLLKQSKLLAISKLKELENK